MSTQTITAVTVQEFGFTREGGKPPEFESLEALFQLRIDTAIPDWVNAGKGGGSIAPHFVMVSPTHGYAVECPWSGPEEKNTIRAMLRQFMREQDVQFFVFCSETWIKTTKEAPTRPYDLSQDPEAEDGFMILGVHKDGRDPMFQNWVRKPDGKGGFDVTVKTTPNETHIGGAFANMLKDGPDNVRPELKMFKISDADMETFREAQRTDGPHVPDGPVMPGQPNGPHGPGCTCPPEPARDAYMAALNAEPMVVEDAVPTDEQIAQLGQHVTGVLDTLEKRMREGLAKGGNAWLAEALRRLGVMRSQVNIAIEHKYFPFLETVAQSIQSAYEKTMADIESGKFKADAAKHE